MYAFIMHTHQYSHTLGRTQTGKLLNTHRQTHTDYVTEYRSRVNVGYFIDIIIAFML